MYTYIDIYISIYAFELFYSFLSGTKKHDDPESTGFALRQHNLQGPEERSLAHATQAVERRRATLADAKR